jgi:hypothetical protein
MRFWHLAVLIFAVTFAGGSTTKGQAYGPPDRGQPGDEMIQEHLKRETEPARAICHCQSLSAHERQPGPAFAGRAVRLRPLFPRTKRQ